MIPAESPKLMFIAVTGLLESQAYRWTNLYGQNLDCCQLLCINHWLQRKIQPQLNWINGRRLVPQRRMVLPQYREMDAKQGSTTDVHYIHHVRISYHLVMSFWGDLGFSVKMTSLQWINLWCVKARVRQRILRFHWIMSMQMCRHSSSISNRKLSGRWQSEMVWLFGQRQTLAQRTEGHCY